MPRAGSNPLDSKGPVVLMAAVAVCIIASTVMMPFVPDDSYISFRYAENLARGEGLTFNPGDPPVEAYSNLLWILLCAMLFATGIDLPSYMPFAGTVIGIGCLVILWLLFHRRGMPPLQMLFPLLIFAGSGPFVMYAISGMEMPLFALFLLVIVLLVDHLLEKGGMVYAILIAVSCVLLALTRPEGLIAFPTIAVALFVLTRRQKEPTAFSRHRRTNLLVSTGVFVVLMAAYHAWRIGYFGELVPTPFLSKGGGGRSPFYAWAQNLYDYFVKHGDFYPPLGFYFVGMGVAGFLGVKMSRSLPWHRQTETIAMVLVTVYSLVYVNFVDWMPGMRYFAPLVGLILFAGAHVQTPIFAAGKSSMVKSRLRLFWLGGIALTVMSYSAFGELRVVTERIEESNRKCLVQLGKWLREVVPPQATLAMSDVGAVPYYSGLKTYDIHPESLTDLHIAKNGFSNAYFYQLEPDVVIIPGRSIFLTKFYPQHYGLTSDPPFQQRYRFLGVTRYDWFLDRCYWIYLSYRVPAIPEAQMENFPAGIGTIRRVGREGGGRGHP